MEQEVKRKKSNIEDNMAKSIEKRPTVKRERKKKVVH